MIVRSWRGQARSSDAPAYSEHFKWNVLPELEKITGFLGASLLRRDGPDSVWNSSC
jgi:hypothetical protein